MKARVERGSLALLVRRFLAGLLMGGALAVAAKGESPADLAYEGMFLEVKVLEVDPIHRRIVLAVTSIPAEQPPRPETPSKIHTDDEVPPVDMSANE